MRTPKVITEDHYQFAREDLHDKILGEFRERAAVAADRERQEDERDIEWRPLASAVIARITHVAQLWSAEEIERIRARQGSAEAEGRRRGLLRDGRHYFSPSDGRELVTEMMRFDARPEVLVKIDGGWNGDLGLARVRWAPGQPVHWLDLVEPVHTPRVWGRVRRVIQGRPFSGLSEPFSRSFA